MWTKNGEIFITHSDIRRANPDVSMPRNLSDELIVELGYFVLHPTPKPNGDVVTQGAPTFNADLDRWEQTWDVREFTPEEAAQDLANRRAAMIVTPRQARLALLGAGQLSNIDAAIAALDEPMKSQVTIEWEYAVSVERMSPWVVAMTESLGMTPEQVDDLFIAAAQL